MALIVVTDVFCDSCDEVWIEGPAGPRMDGKMARENARRRGWTINRNGDFCPDCARAAERPDRAALEATEPGDRTE